MTVSFRSLCKFLSATVICVALAGCSGSSTENSSSGNSTGGSSATTKTETFSNHKERVNKSLQANYIDFSFDYPDDWEIKEGGELPDAKNFVKLEHSLSDPTKGDFSQESLAVGFLKTNGDAKKDAAAFPGVIQQFNAQYQKGFDNYKKLSEGPTKIGNFEGYELRFESTVKDSKRGDVTQWGRVVLLPKPGTKQGVTLVLMATNLSPDVKNIDDLGVKGQLPVILKSFTFEKKKEDDEKQQ